MWNEPSSYQRVKNVEHSKQAKKKLHEIFSNYVKSEIASYFMAIIEDKSLKRSHLTQRNQLKWVAWVSNTLVRRHVNVNERGISCCEEKKTPWWSMKPVRLCWCTRCARVYTNTCDQKNGGEKEMAWKFHRSVTADGWGRAHVHVSKSLSESASRL